MFSDIRQRNREGDLGKFRDATLKKSQNLMEKIHKIFVWVFLIYMFVPYILGKPHKKRVISTTAAKKYAFLSVKRFTVGFHLLVIDMS